MAALHRYHRDDVSEPGDEPGMWSRAELVRVDRKVTAALLKERLTITVKIVDNVPAALILPDKFPWSR